MKKLTKLIAVFLVTSMLTGPILAGCQMSPDEPTPTTQGGDEQNPPPPPGHTGETDEQNPPPPPGYTGETDEQNPPPPPGYTGETDEEILNNARATAVNELVNYVDGLSQNDYDQTNWNTIQSLKTQGTNAINAATLENIPGVLAFYKTQISDIKTKDNGIGIIDFKLIASTTDNTTDGMKEALTQLANQSQILQGYQFNSNSFQTSWDAVQTEITSIFKTYTNVTAIKGDVSSYINDLYREISLLTGNSANFRALTNAFYTANVLGQREYYGYNGYPNDKDAKEAALLAQINGMGITATNIPEAIAALRSALTTSMPAECAAYAQDILQQWENIAQFDGWTTDLMQLGATMNLGVRQTRASVQAANGIVK